MSASRSGSDSLSSSERDRKLLSDLVGRAVKRIHKASIQKYEEAAIQHVALAVAHERMLIASWVAGVFADLGKKKSISREIQLDLLRGEYVEANAKMRYAFEHYAENKGVSSEPLFTATEIEKDK